MVGFAVGFSVLMLGLHEICGSAVVGEHDTCGVFPSCVGFTVGGAVRASIDGLHDLCFEVGAGVGEHDTCGVLPSCVGFTVGGAVRASIDGLQEL